MVSKNIVIVLLLTALILSATATYITITAFSTAQTTEQVNKGTNVGVFVEPVRKTNVGVTVVPLEEGEK